MSGARGTQEREGKGMQGLMGKLQGNRLQGRPRRRRKDNIKVNFKKTEWKSFEWTYVAQDIIHTAIKFAVP
jgi:hypothetical protein